MIKITENKISADEFNTLTDKVGWWTRDVKELKIMVISDFEKYALTE